MDVLRDDVVSQYPTLICDVLRLDVVCEDVVTYDVVSQYVTGILRNDVTYEDVVRNDVGSQYPTLICDVGSQYVIFNIRRSENLFHDVGSQYA